MTWAMAGGVKSVWIRPNLLPSYAHPHSCILPLGRAGFHLEQIRIILFSERRSLQKITEP